LIDTTNPSAPPEIHIRPDGTSTCIELRLGDHGVSRLWIVPFTLRIGAATVRMDGIGGVGTEETHRNRGYSRRVLEAAVEHMQRGDAALSMLYGIRDFYPKFGYATAGPDHLVFLPDLRRDHTLPAGWTASPFTAQDLPAVQALYAQNTAKATGVAVRPAEGGVWANLLQGAEDPGKDSCRVVRGPDGVVHGYLWRARWCWYVRHVLETNYKDALALGEVMADSPVSAAAVLAACRIWAEEEAAHRVVKQVVLAFPPEGPLAAAAMRQDARFVRNYSACGGSMARVLSMTRLLEALLPELRANVRAAHSAFTGSLVLHTEQEAAALQITPEDVTLRAVEQAGKDALRISLPQFELARLALGAFPPADLLARLPEPPSEPAQSLLETLFPLRAPHMYLPDRY